jgi:hypothetical protein
MFDGAFPPSVPYPGCQSVGGYLGPAGATPHVWSLAEWHAASGNGKLRQLGIWLAVISHDPAQSGAQASAAAHALGWAAGKTGADRRAICLDLEMTVDQAWVEAFAAAVNKAGYTTIPYGSQSFVVSDPACAGYWVANWDDIASEPAVPHVIGHQYVANLPYLGGQVDLSVIDDSMWNRLGRGNRHTVA